MGSFQDSLTRMRIMLRDPDGNVWSDSILRVYWNQAQEELFTKVYILSTVENQRVPYQYTYSYTHDWEREFIEGDRLQVFEYSQGQRMVICYPWEAGYWIGGDQPADGGSRNTHPWEAFYAAPAVPIPNLLHNRFLKARYVAFDEEAITPLSQREIQERDRYYKTRSAEPIHYYRPDEFENHLVIYPRPPIVLDELEVGDVYDDDGGLVDWLTTSLDLADVGMVVEEVARSNNLMIVYYYLPYDIPDDAADWYQELEMPPWYTKYIEYGVLERAYGTDNDGTHGPLKDYWAYRKNVGINILLTYERKLFSDRTFVMGRRYQDRTRRRAMLPAEYPRLNR